MRLAAATAKRAAAREAAARDADAARVARAAAAKRQERDRQKKKGGGREVADVETMGASSNTDGGGGLGTDGADGADSAAGANSASASGSSVSLSVASRSLCVLSSSSCDSTHSENRRACTRAGPSVDSRSSDCEADAAYFIGRDFDGHVPRAEGAQNPPRRCKSVHHSPRQLPPRAPPAS